MHPLKVLHVLWSASMGGIGKVVFHLLQEQKKDPGLVTGLLIAKGEGDLLNDFKNLQINTYIAGFESGNQINFQLFHKCKAFMQTFDIIHFHSFNPLLAWAAVRSKKKIIYSEHGNFGLGRKVTFNDRIVRKLQQKFLNNNTNAITYNSKFSASLSRSTFGIKAMKGKVVYNGVPLYSAQQNNENNYIKETGTFLLVAIGRLASVKRFDRLLEAFHKLSLPEARLIIMGEGPEESKLKQQVKTLHLEHQVKFPGYGDARALLESCDVCIAPTQGEAFGLVAIEAYQLGKKVIAFHDGGGLTEIISQLEPDAIVQSTSELANLLRSLYQQRTALTSIENIEKRKEYAKEFSIEIMSESMNALYQSV